MSYSLALHGRCSRQWCRRGRGRRAFSLIEMLVVVSVIALLAAMLLPSLRSARERARTVVCSSNTAAIARAGVAYQTDSNGWICGSPGTSGSVMYGPGDQSEPSDEDIATDPVQIWDYAGALGPKYMRMSLSGNRAERIGKLVTGVFACPSNRFMADPVRGSEEPSESDEPVGSFERQAMVSYNTIRNFMMWPRTMVARDPSQPWGPRPPVYEAGFDSIGGNAMHPRNYEPRIDRIVNPAAKVYLADGNRFTTEQGRVTYDVEWDAEAGGAFCNGGPTLSEWSSFNGRFLLSSYHFDDKLGRYGYRHHGRSERGIVVSYFDGHSEFITETQSREPDLWWPKGTWIPFQEFNDASLKLIAGRLDSDYNYTVGR